MTTAIYNARKALKAYNEPYYGDDPDGSYREDAHRLAEALRDLLDSLECTHLNFRVNGFSQHCTDCGEDL